jgi:hypothetical protein
MPQMELLYDSTVPWAMKAIVHYVSLSLTVAAHGYYILRRVIFRSESLILRSLLLYFLLTPPSLSFLYFVYQGHRRNQAKYWLETNFFFQPDLVQWMLVVLHWTNGCIALSAIIGDRAWWLWVRAKAPAPKMLSCEPSLGSSTNFYGLLCVPCT